MDEARNSTSNVALLQKHMHCPNTIEETFYHTMEQQMWLGNALLLASAGVTAVLVVIGGYVRRYRHHPLTRFIFIGANTLFLPIISYVVSTLSDSSNDYVNQEGNGTTLAALCQSDFHPCMVVTWAFLVQIAAINTTSVVAIDRREGRRIGPPLELIVKGIWIVYLGASITKKRFFHGLLRFSPFKNDIITVICAKIMFVPFILICAKFWFKYYAFQKAQLSFALGRNPSHIFGYMQHLQQQEGRQQGERLVSEDESPPLLVMGEDRRPVVNHPRGHIFIGGSGSVTNTAALITLNKIWQLDNVLPTLTQRAKDLCMSFAFFKLLRCRFARYKLADVGSMGALNFFWSLLLLKDGEHNRVFRVVGDELSFIHDYYYSSLPVSYAKFWLPVLSIFISLLSIGYCIVAAYFTTFFAYSEQKNHGSAQISCKFWCNNKQTVSSIPIKKGFGSFYFDVVPVFLLLVLVLISEVRDMASYICSNWTKVSLISDFVNRASSSVRHPLRMNKWVAILLQCSWKRVMRHWNGKIGQCSVLVLHPRTALLGPIGRLLHWPDPKSKVKLPEAVKIHIIHALRSSKSNGCRLSNGSASLRQSRVGEIFLWACNSKDTSDIMLTWHIATSILQVRHPYQNEKGQGTSPISVSDQKIVATHLSRYCAYLMTWSPELLPDDIAWSTSLYYAVKKDAERLLAVKWSSSTPEAKYQLLVDLLGAHWKHEVLKNGVKLGKQLVELSEGEEEAWKLLAGFWSEMILYVAPSENLKGHSEAIARGGELITLLWSLLFHAGSSVGRMTKRMVLLLLRLQVLFNVAIGVCRVHAFLSVVFGFLIVLCTLDLEIMCIFF